MNIGERWNWTNQDGVVTYEIAQVEGGNPLFAGIVTESTDPEYEPGDTVQFTKRGFPSLSHSLAQAPVLTGFEALKAVLLEAFEQAHGGKGSERHGLGADFFEQPWAFLARAHGPGFLTGQANKKLIESMRMDTEERRTRERLGTMIYLAMAILKDRGAV